MSSPLPQGHFEETYHAHRVALYNFLLRLTGNAHDANDLFQETFLKYYEHQHTLSSIKPWLFQTGYRLFVDQWRKRRNKQALALEDAPEPVAGAADTPEAALLEAEMFREFQQALGQLPPRARAALLLREREGASYLEIAETIGCSENAVKTIIYRARISLRKLLSHENGGI
ncbi:hypothetical protein CBW65_10090 [Tumebacillus avium]|uniref:RNA polymerase subunit sigma n=1 Tax=Tumebacillus avium TaxID=1903704 RepID=A0A1Y0INA5_9BACL|nr:RNA polymerase sigma factor [Tumebacillus avium]ARU61306.1 hypothetical protein CBW65_10090 [Tumebacillus avium]